jgi:hypothetical protein
MLTHVHKMVYFVVSTFEHGLKRDRGVGSLFPSHRAWKAGFNVFVKFKCIFSVALEVRFGEVVGVFLTEEYSPDANCDASDAMLASNTCWSFDAAHSGSSAHPTLWHRTWLEHF